MRSRLCVRYKQQHHFAQEKPVTRLSAWFSFHPALSHPLAILCNFLCTRPLAPHVRASPVHCLPRRRTLCVSQRLTRPLPRSPTKCRSRSVHTTPHPSVTLGSLSCFCFHEGDLLVCPRWRGPLLSWQQQMNVPTHTIFCFSIPLAFSCYSGWVCEGGREKSSVGNGWWNTRPLWRVRVDSRSVLQQPHWFISPFASLDLVLY